MSKTALKKFTFHKIIASRSVFGSYLVEISSPPTLIFLLGVKIFFFTARHWQKVPKMAIFFKVRAVFSLDIISKRV